MAPTKGQPANRTAVERDYYAVKFDMKVFASTHGLTLTGIARAFEMAGGNFQNWAAKGHQYPLSLIKACLEQWDPSMTDAFEKAINGQIIRMKLPNRVTPQVMLWAQRYDARRPGLRLRVKDGSILETPIVAVQAPVVPAPIVTPLPPIETVLAEVAAAAPARQPMMHSFEVPSPMGMMKVQMPIDADALPPGEREILIGLLIRTHYQLVAVERERAAVTLRLNGAESQVESLRRRLQEVNQELKATEELRVVGGKEQGATVATLSAPRTASAKDFQSVKDTVARVPELVQMVNDMEKGMNGSFPKGAALVS